MNPEEYCEYMLDLISEEDGESIIDYLDNGYLIESMVKIHRRLSAQIRYLLTLNYNKKPKKIKCKELMGIIDKGKDGEINKYAYYYDFISKEQLGTLNSLNTMRNKFVHPSKERLNFHESQIKSVIRKAKEISEDLDLKINY